VKTRLADIAAQAGVSSATVSRVLNGKSGVAEETRRLVLTALEVLGYENRSRRGRSAGLVGLITPELENPIFPAFAQVIESGLAQHGYTPVLCTQTRGGISEDDYVEMLVGRGVAGIIFVSGLHANTLTSPARYLALIEQRLPVVFVNGYVEGIPAPFISDDDAAAMELAVGHLVQLGHRRIGLAVGPARYVPVIRKRRGFVEALASALDVSADDAEDWVAHSLFTVEGGQAAALRLIEAGCTAIVCGSDLMALGAIRAIRSHGQRVPQDVSVVGYDDSPLIGFTDPPLTTVRQSVLAMGNAAVQALLDEIAGVSSPHAEYVFRPELVVRGSTAAAPRLRPSVVAGAH
jgi:DNA-binding LacI/PurR family transcriptional regulator